MVADASVAPARTGEAPTRTLQARAWLARRSEAFLIPVGAALAGFVLFGLFLAALGKSLVQFVDIVYRGGFALCVALPARLGLVVIGGEGAIVLGGLAAPAAAQPLAVLPPLLAIPLMGLAAAFVGAVWIGSVGFLQAYRGVNATISSLLLSYIAIALANHLIEGPLRDPASLNKPPTPPIGDAVMLEPMPVIGGHLRLGIGAVSCLVAYVLMDRTTLGFAARIAGGNVRAAQIQGLPVGKLIVGLTALGGVCAALASYFEVIAVQGTANGTLAAGYGYTCILVAFLARQNPLAIRHHRPPHGRAPLSGSDIGRTGLPVAHAAGEVGALPKQAPILSRR